MTYLVRLTPKINEGKVPIAITTTKEENVYSINVVINVIIQCMHAVRDSDARRVD